MEKSVDPAPKVARDFGVTAHEGGYLVQWNEPFEHADSALVSISGVRHRTRVFTDPNEMYRFLASLIFEHPTAVKHEDARVAMPGSVIRQCYGRPPGDVGRDVDELNACADRLRGQHVDAPKERPNPTDGEIEDAVEQARKERADPWAGRGFGR